MTTSSGIRCLWARCAAPGPYADDHALFKHLQAAHNPPPRQEFACQWTGCAYASRGPVRSRQQRATHLICHTNYRPYACTYPGCDWAFNTHSDATKHANRHDWALVPAFPCKWVGCTVGAFSGPAELRAHIEDAHMHLAAGGRGRRCGWEGCVKTGGDPHTISHFPGGYKPFKCDICHKTFKAAAGLAVHTKCLHSGPGTSEGASGDDRASAVAANVAETEGVLFPGVKRARDCEGERGDPPAKKFKDLEGDSESELDIVITVCLGDDTRTPGPEPPAPLSQSHQVIKADDDDWLFYT